MALKVWLPLNGNLNNYGLSNITITNNGTTVNSAGKIGKCYQFDTNKYIKLMDYAAEFLTYQTFSLSVWFKCTAQNTAHSGSALISSGNWNQSNNLLQFSLGNFSSDHYTKLLVSGSGVWSNGYSYDFYLNRWYNVVLTSGNGKMRAYVNGELIGDTYSAFTPASLEQSWICIGNGTYTQVFHFIGFMNDVRIYDHCLSPLEVKEIAQGLVLHYKLDNYYFKSGTNLVTDVTIGNQTTKLTDGRLGVVTSGVNSDTYFTINLSENIVNGTTYHFSCDASGISEGQFWGFPLGTQSNTSLLCKIYNGHNEFVFTANDISWGTNRLFMDDINRTDWAHPATFYNFILTKDATYEIKDSSGYGHNGTINGTLTLSNDTPRYSTSSYIPTTTTITHEKPIPNNTDQEWTCSMWVKLDTVGQSNIQLNNFNLGNRIVHSANGHALMYLNSGTNDYYNYGNLVVTANTWTHIAFIFKNSNATKLIYINGVNHTNTSGPNKTSTPSGIPDTVIVGTNLAGYISDYRVYCTALSADDIKKLYNTRMSIDNLGNIHAFELNESGTNKITKTGILQDNMIEPFITLSDGSKWQLLLFHYVDNGNNLFTSSNAAFCNDFGLYSRLQYIDNFVYDNKYEFYVIQDGATHRWTQTNAPLSTTSVAGLTTISGSPDGGICRCNGNTLLAKTGTTSNWWDACGCYKIYNGGIPGFHGTVCKQYLALYARVSDFNAKIANLTVYSNNFIEQ